VIHIPHHLHSYMHMQGRNPESMSLTSIPDESSWKLAQPKQPINIMAPVTQHVPGHDGTQG
jgi:hypothetical protein